MSEIVMNEVRRRTYLDSVALMRLSRGIAVMADVVEAAVMMGTPSNKQVMGDAGLLNDEGQAAGAADLILGVRATTVKAAEGALLEANRLLDQPTGGPRTGKTWRPSTIRAAVGVAPDANLALISVPGDFAAAEARNALRQGLHVMIFSDNVRLEDELALKHEARDLGLLVMGPDCGTAIVNGVPLAFANKVPMGDIGIIGASGTGIQEISSLIAEGGRGISQAIGVGGRDLKEEIGGITTLMALDALDGDPETKHVVLVSKPPAAAVAERIVERLGASTKKFTVCFIGLDELDLPSNTTFAPTLKSAAEAALGRAIGEGFDVKQHVRSVGEGRRLRGLYSGGTLCAEAQVILRAAGEAAASNAPIPGVPGLEEENGGHRVIDLGDDQYTRGKPHPMIDPSVRDDAMARAMSDPSVGIIVVDIVIGFGAHDDPAGQLVGSLPENRDNAPLVIASVTGTEDDPQRRSDQVATLERAGVIVAPSNADAVGLAVACLRAPDKGED
ncbi:MAG: acyl-CoA synthetase FdrA [Rhodospirillales bacterium]|jgi:succinyl-CoA synthetase alpha subunit|nr:acyl-CoA synthetase FdrA [Rhodospirillales bacterium]